MGGGRSHLGGSTPRTNGGEPVRCAGYRAHVHTGGGSGGSGDPHLVAQRARQLLELGRATQALELAAAAAAATPDAELTAVVAAALRHLDRYQEAVDTARAGLAGAPHDTTLLWELVTGLRLLGDAAEALPHAQALLRLEPDQVSSVQAYVLTAIEVPELRRQALALTDRAVALAPDEPEVHALRGAARRACGDRRGAAAAYRQALALDPHHEAAHRGLIRLRLTRGDLVGFTRMLLASARGGHGELRRDAAEILVGYPTVLVLGGLVLLLPIWVLGWLLSLTVSWGQLAWVVAFSGTVLAVVAGLLVMVAGTDARLTLGSLRAGVLRDRDTREVLPLLVDGLVLHLASLLGGWAGLMAVAPPWLAVRLSVALRSRARPAGGEAVLRAIVTDGPDYVIAWVLLGWIPSALVAWQVNGGHALWGWTIAGQAGVLAVLVVLPVLLLGWRRVDRAGMAATRVAVAEAPDSTQPGAVTSPAFDLGAAVVFLVTEAATWVRGWPGLWALVVLCPVVGLLLNVPGRRWVRLARSGPRAPAPDW